MTFTMNYGHHGRKNWDSGLNSHGNFLSCEIIIDTKELQFGLGWLSDQDLLIYQVHIQGYLVEQFLNVNNCVLELSEWLFKGPGNLVAGAVGYIEPPHEISPWYLCLVMFSYYNY